MRTSTISTPETRVGNKSFQKKLFAARALRQAVIEGLEVRQLFSLSAVDRDAVEPLRLDSGVIQSATASLTTASSSTTAAVGTTLYNSNGFEPTRFQPGNLVGQDPVQGPWVKFGTPEVQVAASGGTVQPVVAATGNQSLRIDRLGADVRFAPFRAAPTAVGETIRMSYDLRVDAAPGAQPFGPFFGIEANSDNGTGGPVRVIGSVGIDAKTGELLVQRAVIGDFIAPGLVLSLNTFHNFKVDLDFLAQTYTVFVDGNPIPAFTGGFVDSTAGSPITSLSDADVAGLADAADAASLAAQGTAYVDNYKLTLLDSGTVVYDSQSFETPRFTSGDIVGQDPANGPWVRFGSTVVVPADATVQGTVALTGTRSLKVERNDGQDERFGPYREVTSVNEQVNIDWIMRVDLAAGPQTFGPYFGIEANNQEADGSVRLIGSAGVDAKTGEILFQRAGTGFLDTTGASVSLGVPHTFELQLNFVTQEYKLLVDSVVRVNETFVDSTALNPIKGFSDADIVALAAGGDAASQAANGVAYVDNYRVSLPEDGTQLYNSEGFEPPKFVDGDVVGQDPAQGVWIQFSGRNVIPGIATTLTGTATVQTAVTNGGVQGVRVDRQNGFDVRWAPFHPHDSIQDAVQLDWTMRVDAAPGAQPFGPFFGVEAYNDNGVGGPVRLIGSAGVDAKTGEVLFQEVGTGNLNTTGVTVSLNAFHAFRMILDFDRQRYMIYVDNTLVLPNRSSMRRWATRSPASPTPISPRSPPAATGFRRPPTAPRTSITTRSRPSIRRLSIASSLTMATRSGRRCGS